MTVKVTKPAVNLREELASLNKPSGIVGESILRADTAADAVEQLNLEDHTFTTFTSTGIDDNATSTALTLDSSGNLLVGTTTTDGGYDESDGGATTVFTGASIGGAASGSASGGLITYTCNSKTSSVRVRPGTHAKCLYFRSYTLAATHHSFATRLA